MEAIIHECSGVPALSAVREWRRAFDLTGGQILAACEAWAQRNAGALDAILTENAVDNFITSKTKAKKQGEWTYRAKLKPLAEKFKGRHLHTLTTKELSLFLETFPDAVTRNDIRKRVSSLCRWAQKVGHLPRFAPLAIADTERAKEEVRKIGIMTPETYRGILDFFRDKHLKLLAAAVLAGLCGIRSDEIHGKRSNRKIRQLYADIHLDRKFVQVTVAKQNTPAWRIVPLCDAAVEWLKLCPVREDGMICDPGDLWVIRRYAIAAGFEVPSNAFRHSFISHRIAETGDKARTATEAGNSVKEIDRRYRVPLPAEVGRAWFSISPNGVSPASPPADPTRTGSNAG